MHVKLCAGVLTGGFQNRSEAVSHLHQKRTGLLVKIQTPRRPFEYECVVGTQNFTFQLTSQVIFTHTPILGITGAEDMDHIFRE